MKAVPSDGGVVTYQGLLCTMNSWLFLNKLSNYSYSFHFSHVSFSGGTPVDKSFTT